ncbi:NPCBM/NEW2 domain-containing protein [Pedobacter sp. MR2016-24]|uniref:NPCBM/NEW2 domain-containing protein n=1 Tax=Pedobacter sp. MR2016-24 TaxID=2994466 RepID=UPI002247E2CA|nr:NPCBM/NEW2 domain-containing protein [Pedobacter sp. MR2016-24]MCX2486214.1 NPCBM/NEW2 domain-containing protein [Pedobacter sp. MR2016-24]
MKVNLMICLTVWMWCVMPGIAKAGDLDSLGLHRVNYSGVNSLIETSSTLKRPLAVNGKPYTEGIAAPEGLIEFDLQKAADHFTGMVGMDDHVPKGGVRFIIMGDRKELFKSPVLRKGTHPISFNVSLKGFSKLYLLVENEGDGIHTAHADWMNAYISYRNTAPAVLPEKPFEPYILTPAVSLKPKINGAKIYGSRPGHPFLYRIAASGKKPMKFTAVHLPEGLVLDNSTGIISGSLVAKGETRVMLTAENELGTASRELRIVGGDEISLTPAMGWNSWNCFAQAVDAKKVMAAADAMVSSGLADHGWNYINIDDCWAMKPGSKDPLLSGPLRDVNGMINSNGKFPDMNLLTDYIHGLGFKAGIYSSPGETTCGEYAASYGFEEKDVQRWTQWKFDYIKYDWCSYYKFYDTTTDTSNIPALQKPFQLLGDGIRKANRDILYSLCQYGMGNVGKWGRTVGGNSWRISRDVHDTWTSMSGIGFAQAGKEVNAGPGHWNDEDMLVIGMVGWGPDLRPTRLSADEQYTHVSLWSLLASPLLIGCDMTRLDAFTKNLLTNDEVIAINQDPLGKQASRVYVSGRLEIWVKALENGSKAVGLFNRGIFPEKIQADWKTIGAEGKQRVRDAWKQEDIGSYKTSYETMLPAHGVRLLIVKPAS